MNNSEINIKAEAAEITENNFIAANNNALFNPSAGSKIYANEGSNNTIYNYGYDMLSDSLW